MTNAGSCLCGGIQYEIAGELEDLAFCHCSMCRRSLGGAFGTYARVDPADFRWLSLGTVSGDPGLRPVAHIFVGSKAPWYEISDDLPQFDEWPPADSEFFQRFD